MFHGKFTYFKNCNGKLCKVEKDFSDPQEFEAFMFGGQPQMAFFDSRGACDPSGCDDCSCDQMIDEIEKLPSGSKISDYYHELQELEAQEQEHKQLLEKKEQGLTELKDLRAKFVDRDRSDIVDKIDADIRGLETEIKEMKKSS